MDSVEKRSVPKSECMPKIWTKRAMLRTLKSKTKQRDKLGFKSESESALMVRFVLPNKEFDSCLFLLSLLWLKQKQSRIKDNQATTVCNSGLYKYSAHIPKYRKYIFKKDVQVFYSPDGLLLQVSVQVDLLCSSFLWCL